MGEIEHKSGYAAIIGKPNAGKSTLMNKLLGTKLSITTHKPQTTRHQVVGIHSEDDAQIIFLDTPGIIRPKYELQKAMMRFVEKAEMDADVILFIVEAGERKLPDHAFQALKDLRKPVILLINKIDLKEQEEVEALAKELNERFEFTETVFVSALQGVNIDGLLKVIKEHIPKGPPFYPKDELSEHPVRFFASELVREQIFLQYHEEIPYSCTVEIVQYEEREDLDYISADIIVNRNSQKGMLIGKGGRAIKKLGTEARKSIEDFVGRKVFLDLHVKVREKWREDENWVRNLGY
ncbi:GTPase Era [Balneola sp. MJW-20]|uniref:GTPase Era n=1 Tax=Gracilimonas aurantiaca TaxID=3234185 RepID=UPI003466AB53